MLRSLLTIWCLCTCALAAHVVEREYRAQHAVQAAYIAGAPIGLSEPAALPYSHKTLRDQMIACSDALGASTAHLLAPQTRATAALNCKDLANRAGVAWPSYGPIALVQAAVAFEQSDSRRFVEALARNSAVARHQGWQAMRRFALLVQATDAHGVAGLEMFLLQDAHILLGMQQGAEFLAKKSMDGGPVAGLIDLALRDAPEAQKRRFRNLVNRKAARS